jgi:reductive dehalogenase
MEFSFDTIDILFIIFCLFLLGMILTNGIVSAIEKEIRATTISFVLCFFPIAMLVLPLIEFNYQNTIELIILGISGIVVLILFMPINNKKHIANYEFSKSSNVDERDIMFSRAELKENSENYNSYYKLRPENFESDEKFRKNPGLLKEGSKYYDPVLFASADASFKTVEIYSRYLNTSKSDKQAEIKPEKISEYIKSWAKQLGAIDCGITELKDYHLYSHTGRKGNYGDKVNLKHKYAIAFTVEMDKYMMAPAPKAPTVMESAKQYLNAGSIAMQINFFLKELGYDALAHIDGNYKVICPLVAKDAGLGEIGRMGLLMTPKLGPRVRIAVVTTDMPLVPDKTCFDPTVIDFCNICKKCADTCPGNAISNKNREIINGSVRWQINQEKCFNYWTVCGTDCGRCMSVCPYSHPDNFLHNFVRLGLKNSMVFRRFALKMDDLIYGRRPAPGKVFDWVIGVNK